VALDRLDFAQFDELIDIAKLRHGSIVSNAGKQMKFPKSACPSLGSFRAFRGYIYGVPAQTHIIFELFFGPILPPYAVAFSCGRRLTAGSFSKSEIG